jgi:hypothetical protein
MPKYHQPLDLGEFPFNNYKQEKIYSSPMNALGSEFKNFIFSKGLILKHILVLWRPAGGGLTVHSDGENYSPSWARLNYIHGGPGTVSWWEANDPEYVPATEGRFPSKPWPMDKIHKVEEGDLTGFNIVNVGSPHGLTNIKSDRWAVSLQLDHYAGHRTSFTDLCNIFADYTRKN